VIKKGKFFLHATNCGLKFPYGRCTFDMNAIQMCVINDVSESSWALPNELRGSLGEGSRLFV